jgi:hypothetical protein
MFRFRATEQVRSRSQFNQMMAKPNAPGPFPALSNAPGIRKRT